MDRRQAPVSQLQIFTVEYLMHLILEGHVRIPSYSRRFIWRNQQTILLLDSIVRGYPIGTIMFSEGPAPEEEISFGPIMVHAPAEQRAYWVIDGQQRLVSLVSALYQGNDKGHRFTIAYDLQAETFVADARDYQEHVIPLPVLFNARALMDWLSRNSDNGELFERASDISWRLRGFQVAIYIIHDENPLTATAIFERLNTSGAMLRPSDLFSAFASGATPSSKPRRIEDVMRRVADRTGFGILDDTTVLRAILSIRTIDVASIPNTRLEELQAAYDEGEQALSRAIVFLQSMGQIPHASFLPTKYPLIVLTRFFAEYPEPDTRNRRLLRRWLWRSIFTTEVRTRGETVSVALSRALGAIRYGDE